MVQSPTILDMILIAKKTMGVSEDILRKILLEKE
jgi:hypothetical protein